MSAFADFKGFAQAIGAALLAVPKADLHTVLTPVVGQRNIDELPPGTVVITSSYFWEIGERTPYDKLIEDDLKIIYVYLGDDQAVELYPSGDCFSVKCFGDNYCNDAEAGEGEYHPYCFVVNLPIDLSVTNKVGKHVADPAPEKPPRKLAFLG